MGKIVLDSSAALAALQKQPGSEKVLSQLKDAVISAVNFAEVVSKLAATGKDISLILSDLHDMIPEIHPFDVEHAMAAGKLIAVSRALGLSLGDWACLTLAKRLGVPAVTADPSWAALDVGIPIELIR